jgi:hypothetical protein
LIWTPAQRALRARPPRVDRRTCASVRAPRGRVALPVPFVSVHVSHATFSQKARPRLSRRFSTGNLRSLLIGGGIPHSLYHRGFSATKSCRFSRSALIESAIQSMEHAMNRCPVESSLAHVRKSKVRVVLGGRHHTTQRLYHGLCHHESSASEPCRLSYIRAHGMDHEWLFSEIRSNSSLRTYARKSELLILDFAYFL